MGKFPDPQQVPSKNGTAGHPTEGHHRSPVHHHRRKHRHRKRTCGNPPSTPTGVVLTYTATEAMNHLRFTGKVKWNEVTTDIQGHGLKMKRYDVQIVACNASGTVVETEDAKPRTRRLVFHEVTRWSISAATIVSGTTAEFTLSSPDDTLNVGDHIRVVGVTPAAYNGSWTVSALPTAKKVRANIGASPADGTDFGEMVDDEDSFHVIQRHVPRPKTWYWKTRVRCVDINDCKSLWTAWSSPVLPWTGSDPQPPAPVINSLTYPRTGTKKDAHRTAKINFSEVLGWDVPGGDHEDDVHGYVVQIWCQTGGLGTWELLHHKHRSALDASSDTTQDVVFVGGIRGRNKYRVRARTIDRYGRVGNWTAFFPSTSGSSPAQGTNPARNVVVTNPAGSRIHVTWDPPQELDVNGTDLGPDGVDLYKVEMYQGATLKLTARTRAQHYRYVVPTADKGKTHNAKVYAVDEDGVDATAASSGTVSDVSSIAVTDGLAPGSSPSLATGVTGAPGMLSLRWTAVANADPVQYEVHVSTSSGFTPGAGTLVGVVSGTMATIRSTGGGTPLVVGTTYYVKLIAVDADCTGYGGSATAPAAGTQGSGVPSAVSDGLAPSSSPSLATGVVGMSGAISLRWTKITNADPVIYEVHISTSSGFTPSGATLIGTTGDTTTIVRVDATGAALLPNTVYYFKLVAVDQDVTGYGGSASPPAAGTQGSGRMAGDGSAPASSPTPTVTGMVQALFLKWPAIANNDAVTYEIHISTSTGFTPSGSPTPGTGTFVARTSATLATVRTLADGTPLVVGTPYYVRLVATDQDCTGYGGTAALPTASTEVPGQLALAGSSDVDSITADQILAGNLLSQVVVAGFIGSDDQGAPSRHWEADPGGIRLYDATGAPLVLMPTSGDPVTVNAEVVAQSLDVPGDAVFRGDGNLFERGSTTMVAAGVSAPIAAPTVAEQQTFLTLAIPSSGTATITGSNYDPAGGAAGTTPSLLATRQNGTSYVGVDEYNFATGALLRSSADIGVPAGVAGLAAVGICRASTFIFILFENLPSSVFYLVKLNQSTLAWVSTTNISANVGTSPQQPGLFYDGSNLNVIGLTGGGGTKRINLIRFNTTPTHGTDLALDSTVLLTPTTTLLNGGVRLTEAAINGGSACYWVVIYDTTSGRNANYAFDASTGTLVSNVHFISYGNARGLMHDGTRFWSVGGSATKTPFKHSNVRFAVAAAYDTFWFGYTWYDSVGTTHETTLSPRKSFNLYKRRTYQTTTPAIPVGPAGVDDPDTERIYVKQNATDPGATLSSYFRQGGNLTVPTNAFDTYDTSTAGSAGTAFPASTPGVIESATGTWQLLGNGHVIIPTHGATATRTSTQTITTATWTVCTLTVAEPYDDDNFHDLVTNAGRFTVPVTGLYCVVWNVGWTGNATGRRGIGVLINGATTPDADKNTTIPASVATAIRPMVSLLLRLTAGDYIECAVFQDSGAGLTVTDARLTIELIHQTA